jgi:hypothetical protein
MSENSPVTEVKPRTGEVAKKLLLTILGLTVAVSLLLIVIGLISAWHSMQFSNGFFIAGCLFGMFGLLSVVGNLRARSNFGIVYGQSASDMNLAERTKQWMADINQGYNAMIVLVATAALLIGVAVLIDKLFA